METRLFPGVLPITTAYSTRGHDYGETAPLQTPLLPAKDARKVEQRLSAARTSVPTLASSSCL